MENVFAALERGVEPRVPFREVRGEHLELAGQRRRHPEEVPVLGAGQLRPGLCSAATQRRGETARSAHARVSAAAWGAGGMPAAEAAEAAGAAGAAAVAKAEASVMWRPGAAAAVPGHGSAPWLRPEHHGKKASMVEEEDGAAHLALCVPCLSRGSLARAAA